MYCLTGVFPFGPKTVVSGDMLNQYVAIASFIKRAFLHPSMLFYTSQIGLGINTWPMFAYYGTSPLGLIALLFPVAYLPFYFELNVLISTGLISLTTYLLLKKSKLINIAHSFNNRGIYVVRITFSSAFALSGYFINYSSCTMWLNAIILFPVVLLGWEKLIGGQNEVLYLVSLTALIFVNYYIGVIVLEYLFLISACWVLYSLMQHQLKNNISRCIKLIIVTALAILNNIAILLPSFVAQREVQQAKFVLSLHKIMPIRDFISSFYPLIANGQLIPLFYAGITVCFLAIAYFFTGISWKERIITFLLVVFLLLSAIVQALYMAWHSFSMPNGFPQREAFVIIFTLILISYRALLMLRLHGSIKAIVLPTIILIVTRLILSLTTETNTVTLIISTIVTLLIAVIIYAIMEDNRHIVEILFIFTISELGIAGYPNYHQSSLDSLSWRPFAKYVKQTQLAVNSVQSSNMKGYRLATNANFNMNDPLLFGYNSVSGYVSQLPSSETNYISQLGYYQKHTWYRWSDYNNGSTLAINRLMGFKYYLTLNNQSLLSKNGNNIFLVKNKPAKFVPLASQHADSYDLSIDREASALVIPSKGKIFNDHFAKYDPSQSPFTYFNRLFKEIYGNDQQIYAPLTYKVIKSNHSRKVYQLTSNGEMMYAYIPTRFSNVLKSLKISVNGENVANVFGGHDEAENGVICLGKVKTGEKIYVDIKGKGASEVQNMIIVSENSTSPDINGINNLSVKTNKIYWQTNDLKHSVPMLITLAYNKGWHATIDNKKAVVKPAAGNLMGINVPKGKHKIKMVYYPPKLKLGLLVTTISILSSIILVITGKNLRERTIN